MKLIKNAYLAVNRNGNTVICGSKPIRVNDRWVINAKHQWAIDSTTYFFHREFPCGHMVSVKGQTWKDEPVCIGDISI